VTLGLLILGGSQPPFAGMTSWSKSVANLLPSRWAFEGLLLLEAESTPEPEPNGTDLAEYFFPAETDRMGVRTDALALILMVIGMAGSAGFISMAVKPAARELPVS
jgi:hypothetical protein